MKKAQLQMAENVAIVFIFLILVILGIVFFTGVEKTTSQRATDENLGLRSIQIAQTVSFLPELRCSSNNVPVHDCYDIYKMIAFGEMTKDRDVSSYYFDLFEYSLIEVRELYPGRANYTLYNKTDANWSDVIPTQIPISIYNVSADKPYAFGILEVGVYFRGVNQ